MVAAFKQNIIVSDSYIWNIKHKRKVGILDGVRKTIISSENIVIIFVNGD
jgi:hypothetical protein